MLWRLPPSSVGCLPKTTQMVSSQSPHYSCLNTHDSHLQAQEHCNPQALEPWTNLEPWKPRTVQQEKENNSGLSFWCAFVLRLVGLFMPETDAKKENNTHVEKIPVVGQECRHLQRVACCFLQLLHASLVLIFCVLLDFAIWPVGGARSVIAFMLLLLPQALCCSIAQTY